MSDSLNITPNVTLYDDAGNPVNVILTNGIYRLAGSSIITDAGGKIVSVITDDMVERLAVDAKVIVTNNESPTKYQLRSNYNATGVSVGTTDVTLYEYVGSGVIDSIAVTNPNASTYEVAIVIDGTERVRITMNALGSDLGLSSSATPIWVETANKNFRFVPRSDIGFTQGFSVIARSTSGTTTLRHIVLYREKVD